ncbi:hypothetical protein [Deinococcus petrolearius]|uniref:Uncharacterized protein n=1 Tax=Deinococcus petrolearius TaxID=1751295 RepID=A0ABW1DNS4_9DEIO
MTGTETSTPTIRPTEAAFSEAAQAVQAARSTYSAAAETEAAHKLALGRQENAVLARAKGDEGALTGSSAEARAAQLALMFEEDRARVREAEQATRAARLTLDDAETVLTCLRYQVRLLEAAASR